MEALANSVGLRYMGSAITQFLTHTNLRSSSPEAYRKLRDIICKFELTSTTASDMELTKPEVQANDVVMRLKMNKYNKGIEDPYEFNPGFHIFERLNEIEKSPLFRLIRKMPKGGALKTNDISMCSTAYLIQLTYKKNLWVYTFDDGEKIDKFRFSDQKPQEADANAKGKWESMEQLRDRRGEDKVRKQLQKCFSMYPLSDFTTNAHAWQHLIAIFKVVGSLLRSYQVWGDYYYNALREFSEDGIQYVEVRSSLPRLFTMDGTRLPVQETLQSYRNQLKKFQTDHPDFIGAKVVYSPLRHVSPERMASLVSLCTQLNKEYPELLIGFDLVGREELGPPLSAFVEQLLKLPPQIDFYFHAGQTNWYGSHADENLIDAVLLGARRIANAYAITKHPLVMELVKRFDTAIEISPVGNQVLQMGTDYRNHPAALMIANDIPFVLSSGIPSFCRTRPLSHDFYMAFLGIAPRNADLRFLKRVAKNSIKYSSLNDDEKAKATEKWKKSWTQWVEYIIKNKDAILQETKQDKKK